MFKKITSLILSVVMLTSCASASFGVSAAEDTVLSRLCELASEFPAGKYWNHMGSDKNNPDECTDTPCASHKGCDWHEGACSCNSFDKAIQCMGYAYKIAYEITGVSARSFKKSRTLSAKNLRVGDVIRYRNDRHSLCVTGVSGSRISFTDCNWDRKCGIRWGVMDISDIDGFSYVLHLDGNSRKNTDLDFYKDVKPDKKPEESVAENYEIWKMGDGTLNVRASASTKASVVGTFAAGKRFRAYEKKISDGYLWARVQSGTIKGWAVLNYSEYVSGAYEKPELSDMMVEYPVGKSIFSWSEVSGADRYQLRIYDSEKNLLDYYHTTETEYKVTFDSAGTYYAKVYSLNEICSDWKIDGELISFTVKAEEEEPEEEFSEISLPEEVSIKRGASKVLTLKTTDAELEDEDFTWHSDDASVATVTADGEVTANGFGKAKIICSSADGKTSAFCTVTVVPDTVAGFKQSASKTKGNEILLKWNAVDGVTGYQVKRYNSSTKKYEKLATTTKTSYTDKTAKEGKDYYYVVRAYAKTEQGYVYGKNVKIKCSSAPAKVTGLTQSSTTSGTVTLKWNKVKNADLYAVYKYNSKTKKYTEVKTLSGTSLKVSQKAAGSVYYRVYAVTKTEWGNVRSAVSAAFKATSGPDKVKVKLENYGTARVKISWNKVSGATHYQIFRKTTGGYTKIATIESAYGSFKNTNLKSKTDYTYMVRAVTIKNGKTCYGSYSDKVTIRTK